MQSDAGRLARCAGKSGTAWELCREGWSKNHQLQNCVVKSDRG